MQRKSKEGTHKKKCERRAQNKQKKKKKKKKKKDLFKEYKG